MFENRDKIIIVMEYASGGELYDYVSSHGSLSETEARRLFRQITSAVFFLHKVRGGMLVLGLCMGTAPQRFYESHRVLTTHSRRASGVVVYRPLHPVWREEEAEAVGVVDGVPGHGEAAVAGLARDGASVEELE